MLAKEGDNMNLGRFHSAITTILNEIQEDLNFDLLENLQTSLQNSISQQSPESGMLFKKAYSDLIDVLENAESNFTFSTRRKIYQEIGITQHIGIELSGKIKNAISENQIAPVNALAEIQKINKESKQFYDKLVILDNTFTDLKIEYDDLDEGEFEIGFSFPHDVIGTDLESLEKEFHRLDFALKTLQEISLGQVGQLSIKSISASEWQVFLNSLPTLAACTAVTIERIVALYKSNLEIKLLKQQLDNKNLPKKVTRPLQEHIEQAVKTELRQIAEDIVDEFYQVKDEGRKNELKNMATQALQYIADRMDHGATVEVHAQPPKEPKQKSGEDEGKDSIDQISLEEYQRINKIAIRVNNLSKLTLELEQSSGPILSLKFED